jgi:nucleoside 2-deoxyribosyltransferase
MPFTPEFNDIYILGIRETAEKLGIVVERADSIEHNESIPDVIRREIEECDVVVADTTQHNPNVFYEVGLAHGIGKKTILICRDVNSIPFDLGAINHIVYSSIVELREKLKARLQATLQV